MKKLYMRFSKEPYILTNKEAEMFEKSIESNTQFKCPRLGLVLNPKDYGGISNVKEKIIYFPWGGVYFEVWFDDFEKEYFFSNNGVATMISPEDRSSFLTEDQVEEALYKAEVERKQIGEVKKLLTA